MSEPVVAVHDGSILRLTVNRPKQLNAMNAEVLAALREALGAAAGDQSIRAIVIEGAGDKAFVAGADIREMIDYGPREGMARLIGAAAAKRLALTGEIIDAPTALGMHLVDALHPVSDFPAAVTSQMRRFVEMSPTALGRIKALFRHVIWDGVEAAHELEKLAFAQCFATADQKEGMSAFAAQRTPRFTGG